MSQSTRSFNASQNSISWTKLIICLAIVAGIGQASMWLSGAWQGYTGINVSSLTPPPYLTGIVWSVLYILMGASLFVVLDSKPYTIRSKKLKNTSLTLWIAQFILILLTPFLLFSQGLFMLTFVAASLTAAIIAALAIINLKVATSASVLLLPCLAWMFFETYLSLIILLNNF